MDLPLLPALRRHLRGPALWGDSSSTSQSVFQGLYILLASVTPIACGGTPPHVGSASEWVGTITTEGNVTTVVNESGSVWGSPSSTPIDSSPTTVATRYRKSKTICVTSTRPLRAARIGPLRAIR